MAILRVAFFLLLKFFSLSLFAQGGNETDTMPTNSFTDIYRRVAPALKYSFVETTMTHNYSGNWDLDGDGKADSVYFIGNGAVHVYFHLKLVLSSMNTIHEFRFIQLDLPVLESVSYLEENEVENAFYPQFVVGDFNADGRSDIYVCIDTTENPIPRKIRRMGIRSNRLLICSDGSKLQVARFLYQIE